MGKNSINILPMDFIQCSSNYIKRLENENAVQEGTLYFVLDTKQILLGKNSKLVSMGKSTGIRFAAKKTNFNSLNPIITFSKNDLEDKSSYPQVDDLIFNTEDSCFYRVIEIESDNINTKRLTIAGSGGGTGGGSSSGGSVNVNIKISNEAGTFPSYIIMNKPDEIYELSNMVELEVNGKPSLAIIKQYIRIGNQKIRLPDVKPTKENIIKIKNDWFKSSGEPAVSLIYEYSGKELEYPLGNVIVFDLSISQNLFKDSGTLILNRLTFNGKISINESEGDSVNHKIYFLLKNSEGKEVPEECYSFNFTKDEMGKKYTQTDSSGAFTLNFNLSYDIYEFEIYQQLEYFGESFIGPKYTYKFIFVPSGIDVNEQPLLLCDFNKINDKEFSSEETIRTSMILYDPLSKAEGIQTAKVNTGYIVQSNNTLIPTKLSQNIFYETPSTISFENLLNGLNKIYVSYEYERSDDQGVSETKKIVEIGQVNIIESVEAGQKPSVFLTAENRTNIEDPSIREIWTNSANQNINVKTSFNNLTWTNTTSSYHTGTGWCVDEEGINVLRLSGDANTVIDYNPFGYGFYDSNGLTFTIDFLVNNFTRRNDIDNPIIKCFDDNQGFGLKIFGDYIQFSTIKETVKLSFLEGERLNLSIVCTPLEIIDGLEQGLIRIYLNGVLSAVRIYDRGSIPVNFDGLEFLIGNKNAIIDLYSITIFDLALTSQDIVKEYLKLMSSSSLGTSLYTENNIYNGEGTVDIEKVKTNTKLPIMILEGELPTSKSDKSKTVDIVFTHPERQGFSQTDVPIEVQGTSSQYYPVKNYKLKNVLKSEGGYELGPDQVKTSTFCLKADYAESTGTHNTQNANFVENFYSKLKVQKNPAQMINPNCRTTIYGYPILVFQEQKTETGTQTKFLGKYNFNFDKGSKEVFGFKDNNGECWEFKDNEPVAGMQILEEDIEFDYNWDTISGVKPIRTTKGELFAWDKWQVTFTSTADNSKTITKYFPEDFDTDRGWNEERKTNIDYVREKAQQYLQEHKTDDSWWNQASYLSDKIIPMWAGHFEARYREKVIQDKDGNPVTYTTNSGEVEEVYDISNFAELYNWIMSTAILKSDSEEIIQNKKNKFNEGIYSKFDKDYLLIYYVYTFFGLMVDQRAKNMFFAYWEPVDEEGNIIEKGDTTTPIAAGGKWQPWFYDNDTCFGIDNSGFEKFEYDSEDDNTDELQIFQGENSALWLNLKATKTTDIASTYTLLRNNGLTEDGLKTYFIENSAKKWPMAIYNEDSEEKYIKYAYSGIDIPDEEKNEDVIGKLRGDGISHFKRFIPDRLFYCDTKWQYNNVSRANNARFATQINQNKEVTLNFIPFTTGYYSLLAGADNSGVGGNDLFASEGREKMKAGVEYLKTFYPPANLNVVYITNANNILNYGDLSLVMPSQFEAEKSNKIENLSLGNKEILVSNTDSYEYNPHLKPLSLKNSKSLKTIDISNIAFKDSALDVSNCPNIREIYARNSEITGVNLSNGGYVETMLLSDLVNTLELKRQLLITDGQIEKNEETEIINGLVFENRDTSNAKSPYRNLTKVIIEDCPNFNSKSFLSKCLIADSPDNASKTQKIIRITGINYTKDENGNPDSNDPWVFSTVKEFLEFANLFKNSSIILKGQDDRGNITDKPYLQGTCYIDDSVTGDDIDTLKNCITGDFNIEAKGISFTIRFFVIDPRTGERVSIKTKTGKDYIQIVNPSSNRKNIIPPYNELSNDLENDYVPDFEYNGLKYIHNKDRNKWNRVPKNTIPTNLSEFQANALSAVVDRNYDLYAVYHTEKKSYTVSFFNGSTNLNINQTIYHGNDYNETLVRNQINAKYPIDEYPKGMPYYGDNPSDYEFNWKWDPEPINVTEDMRCQALYDYTAYQTFRLLEREIEIFEPLVDDTYGLSRIEPYSFYGCTKLKKIILNVDYVIELVNINAFEGSSFDDSANTEIKGYIYVPDEATKAKYEADSVWGLLKGKFKIMGEE